MSSSFVDTTPQTEALGITVSELVGQSLASLRTRLSGANEALIMDDEPVPDGWPEQILHIEDDVVYWACQGADGLWHTLDAYRLFWSRERHRGRVGRLYSRAPAATPHTLVCPVLWLRVGDDDVCEFATAFLDYHRMDWIFRREELLAEAEAARRAAEQPGNEACGPVG